MTVKKLSEELDLTILSGTDKALCREVTDGYCGDLLSWVMGSCGQQSVWLTIMTNINVAAVAVLADVSCVLLCEGQEPDDNLLQRAKTEDLVILSSPKQVFLLAGQIYALLK